MLTHLSISNMLLIDQLSLDFQPGLNALTGETGAGKSILLDSLGFVLGWRGRADMVRAGADQGQVTAEFVLDADHPARAVLADAGMVADDMLYLRRVNSRDGRKTSYVNDQRASGDLLKRLSETLVELHGQNDERGLLNARAHLGLLDAFGGIDTGAVGAAWAALSKARKALIAYEEELAKAREEEDFLSHAVAELEEFATEIGEDKALDEKRRLMQAGARIRADIQKAYQLLGYDGAEGVLGDATRWLNGAAEAAEGRLDAPLDALSAAMTALGDAQAGVEAALAELDVDPNALELTEERLFALRALARKHQVQPDDLVDLGESMRVQLDQITAGDADVAALRADLSAAEVAYQREADALSTARRAAAGALDTAIMAELAPLRMDAAVFETYLTAAEPTAQGQDHVEFMIATNPGTPAGPLIKVASGGELSRFLLAMKVCLTRDADGLTLIFDEIDRGVGGATADAVGARLKSLSGGGQVLVVTHSPQVAAKAGHQWQVSKSVEGDVTTTHVTPLAPAERVTEIARMLAGDQITPEAEAAASRLLAD